MSAPHSASSRQQLISQDTINPLDSNFDNSTHGPFYRNPSTVSATDIALPKVLEGDADVGDETFIQVDIENEDLLRKTYRSELGSKNKFLTRRWQTALVSTSLLLLLAGGIGGLAYWITIPKVITQPYLLYGETCYMNSRSCDATRMLWCPAGTCICTGNFHWNSTAQNCSCGAYQFWNDFKCQDYGYYGDPCVNPTVPCQPTLTCSTVINQTYSTHQDICVCDSTTYLQTTSGANQGKCVDKLSYLSSCLTASDCKDSLGLSCTSNNSVLACRCSSTSYWNGSICVQNALGWEACSGTIPCDTTRGLTCSSSNICECDSYSYWDNVTTLWCQSKKTYGISCQFSFQCNTTVNLSCPSVSTGCNCGSTSYAYMCDCQAGNFWDGQRCVAQHIFNGTCPGQYACSPNLVCYLGHCICPGNMQWNNPTANRCACSTGTTWNTTSNTCV